MGKTTNKPTRAPRSGPTGYALISKGLSTLEKEALAAAKRLAAQTPGIQGVDFGFVTKSDRLTGELGIRFHVIDKLPDKALAGEFRLPGDILGVRCDVVEARYDSHSQSRWVAMDPIRPGISVGNMTSESTGTLGAFVVDRITKAPGILSNWHVLAGSKIAARGEIISQPGPLYLFGQPARRVATLERWAQLEHAADAAFALLDPLDPPVVAQPPLELPTAPTSAVDPQLGMRVIKTSATTDVTPGVIDGLDGSFPVNYTNFGLGIMWLDGFRVVPDPDDRREEISMRGDSGAVWVRRDAPDQAVGLHFGGEPQAEPNAEYALSHSISRVLDLLGVEFPA